MTKSPEPPRTERFLDQEKLRNAERAAGFERVAFLAGPYIETTRAPRKNAKNKAAILRYKLYHDLEAEGWIVTLGEYQKLIDAASPLLGGQNNAAVAEISHARSRETDAVIIIPSSPGSFLELGAFSNFEDICTKMLVIVDAQYREVENYMNLGPVKAARDKQADVRYISYADLDCCWVVVEQFVTECARRKVARVISTP